MTSPTPSGAPRGGAPSLELILPPFEDGRLPPLVASDQLIGGTFIGDYAKLDALRAQIVGSASDWVLVPNEQGQYEVLVDYGQLVAETTNRTNGALACSFVSFRILVIRPDEVPQLPEQQPPSRIPPGLHQVVTHLFVDQPWAMIYGREIFGFPAVLAEIEHQTNDADDVVKVWLDGPKRAEERKPEERAAVELSWSRLPGSRPPALGTFWEMVKANASSGQTEAEIPFLQHKQMRDALDPTRASYQALIRGAMTIEVGEGNRTKQLVQPTVEARSLGLRLTRPDVVGTADLGLGEEPRFKSGYFTTGVRLRMAVTSAREPQVVRRGRNGPRLRQRRGDPQAAPAYTFEGVEIVGFKLPVAQERLQALCDTWLNDPFPERRYTYVPANVDLVVECLHYPSMRSENPPPGVSAKESTSQRELVFRMLVGRVDEDGRMLRAPAVFCPFLFVDNTASLISGREVIGYPKLMAGFTSYGEGGQFGKKGQFEACQIVTIPRDPSEQGPSELLTIDCRYDRQPRDVRRLFGPNASTRPPTPRPLDVSFPLDFVWWALPELQSGGHPGSFLEAWLDGSVYGYGGIQAKRFPDANTFHFPCFEDVVDGEYTLQKAQVSVPWYDAALHFPEADTCGIREAFDFARVVSVPPGSWYRTRADFVFRVTDPLA